MSSEAGMRPKLMGILNLTPDSFSDAGEHFDPGAAVEHGLQMADEGAEIIDVGGESTRPGAGRVPVDEQCARVLDVIQRLRRQLPAQVSISIDTTHATVARAALDAGAALLNDVAAGRESAMMELAAERGVPIVLMHMLGAPATMQNEPRYEDVVAEIRAFLLERAQSAERAGVPREHIIIDPGIGFGKTRRHNLTLMAHLPQFVDTGYAVMLGTSRKRFMGAICDVDNYRELVAATCATTALGVMAGIRFFRVHDVRDNRQALDVAWAILTAQ